MSLFYKLVGHEAVQCTAIEGASVLSSNRILFRDEFMVNGDPVLVSTSFLGMDYGTSKAHPLVFETMVFGGEHSSYLDRYSTWDEATAGHLAASELVRFGLIRNP